MSTPNFEMWALDAFKNTSWVDKPTVYWFSTCLHKTFQAVKGDKPLVIGLCGNMGCGKDSVARWFTHRSGWSTFFRSIAFADPIREIGKIFGFIEEQMTDRKLKETIDKRWGISPRTFMQKVGTEMFRDHLDEDVWVKLALDRIEIASQSFLCPCVSGEPTTRDAIFVTDVRFPNEVKSLRDIGGKIVKISREGYDKSGKDLHPSERYISEIEADLVIKNDAPTLEEFQWNAAKQIGIWLKHDTFYDLENIK